MVAAFLVVIPAGDLLFARITAIVAHKHRICAYTANSRFPAGMTTRNTKAKTHYIAVLEVKSCRDL
jgi:hypothetical protein